MGIGAHEAMKIAEGLYLKGFITYPRTESTAYSPNYDFKAVLSSLLSHPKLGKIAKDLFDNGFNPKNEGVNAGDHPPITPIKSPSHVQLSPKESELFDIVASHFLASISEDCVYEVISGIF